jgi:hypothetical protein
MARNLYEVVLENVITLWCFFIASHTNHKRRISNLQQVPLHALQPRGSRIHVKGITATLLLWISNLLCWLFVALLRRKLKAVVWTVTAPHAAKMDRYYKAWLFITSATCVWPVPCWGISEFSSRILSSKSELLVFRFGREVTFEDCTVNK